jgi:CBS domain containing-hemolysin-like protein
MPFNPLPISTLAIETGYCRPYFNTPNLVTATASALEVMTDLRYAPAAIIQENVDLDTATQKMIARGVRALLVINDADDVVGIITARDLLGNRLEQILNTGRQICDIRVREIMTPHEKIEVLPLNNVLHAHVGDIVETLKHSGRQHALVVEKDPLSGKSSIRGIFSASQVARQLGIPLQGQELTQTFEQIDQAINAHLAL